MSRRVHYLTHPPPTHRPGSDLFRPGVVDPTAGVTPRAIRDLFDGLQSVDECEVFCSFVQVYNENLYDLLRDPGKTAALTVHEDRKQGIYVEGLSEYQVRSQPDLI